MNNWLLVSIHGVIARQLSLKVTPWYSTNTCLDLPNLRIISCDMDAFRGDDRSRTVSHGSYNLFKNTLVMNGNSFYFQYILLDLPSLEYIDGKNFCMNMGSAELTSNTLLVVNNNT